jgi:hypothetical protein
MERGVMAVKAGVATMENKIEIGTKGGQWDKLKWNGHDLPGARLFLHLEPGSVPTMEITVHAKALQAVIEAANVSLEVIQEDGSILMLENVRMVPKKEGKSGEESD